MGRPNLERSRVSTEFLSVMMKQTIQIFARVKPPERKQQQGVQAAGSEMGRVGAPRGGGGGARNGHTDCSPEGGQSPPTASAPRLPEGCTRVHVSLFTHSPAPGPIHTGAGASCTLLGHYLPPPQPSTHSLELSLMGQPVCKYYNARS